MPCPSDTLPGREADCIFVSYFVFSEGAAPGEAGVLAFVKPLPADNEKHENDVTKDNL